ncbi:MAG: tRNA (adenosine(37)-N6)-threonylcarbamoyltransferase complex ATPase subunit type 1 TsaE [Bacteroidales bacterium]|jgi:tRNA threonylcarbamoyladenosine biosynthesis protein TsaE|nr:tRNA (adenosine(37)-N6)-threonylcarbamoyltransferase complex ATPase subunit type 1 TsaE [Bacteroidales bacterium]
MDTFIAHSINDLLPIAKKLVAKFPHERIFALYGQMGAGKTTFMQSVVKALNSKDTVSSPTFALVNEYESETVGIIYHFDFYRIKDIKEAVDIGFDEYLDSENYCFIEWAEYVEELLPDTIVKVYITVNEENNKREFRF